MLQCGKAMLQRTGWAAKAPGTLQSTALRQLPIKPVFFHNLKKELEDEEDDCQVL